MLLLVVLNNQKLRGESGHVFIQELKQKSSFVDFDFI